MKHAVVSLTVNGAERQMLVAPGTTLLDALRENQGLTGTRRGCDQGACGACTVLLDGRTVMSCMVPVETVDEARVDTIASARGSWSVVNMTTREQAEVLRRACWVVGARACSSTDSGTLIESDDAGDSWTAHPLWSHALRAAHGGAVFIAWGAF